MLYQQIRMKEEYPFLGANGADPQLRTYCLDPVMQNVARPSILLCPGGGYRTISGREAEPIATILLSWGYNVFVLYYSVDGYAYPTQVREVAAAMELIHKNAEAWNVDTQRIGIMGFSAGGHLAAHYSNIYDCPEIRELFPDSKPVQATVLGYPVINATPGIGHTGTFQRLAGCDALTQAHIDKLSCDQLVTENTPPAFLWHTATDAAAPVMNSMLYAQALLEKGVPVSLHIYPFGKHGLSTVDELTNRELEDRAQMNRLWLTELQQWLNTILK